MVRDLTQKIPSRHRLVCDKNSECLTGGSSELKQLKQELQVKTEDDHSQSHTWLQVAAASLKGANLYLYMRNAVRHLQLVFNYAY